MLVSGLMTLYNVRTHKKTTKNKTSYFLESIIYYKWHDDNVHSIYSNKVTTPYIIQKYNG